MEFSKRLIMLQNVVMLIFFLFSLLFWILFSLSHKYHSKCILASRSFFQDVTLIIVSPEQGLPLLRYWVCEISFPLDWQGQTHSDGTPVWPHFFRVWPATLHSAESQMPSSNRQGSLAKTLGSTKNIKIFKMTKCKYQQWIFVKYGELKWSKTTNNIQKQTYT